jgi:restriction endonuclease Mrr
MDSGQLTSQMIKYGLGTYTFATYELKMTDNDYLGE